MYFIDKRIERLESQLEQLNVLNDTIDMQLKDAVYAVADEVRELMTSRFDDLVEECMNEMDLSMFDGTLEQDLDDELREEFYDAVRMDI